MSGTALLLCGAGLWAWRAHRAVDEARTAIQSESEIRFSRRVIERPGFGFVRVGAPASFRDAVVFQDKLWVLGADGLYEVTDGGLARRFGSGEELPSAVLSKVVAGNVSGSTEPQMFVGTQGEGFAIYDGRVFQQILPEQVSQRRVTALLLLESGQLLIGTERGGVLAWDGQRLTRFHETLNDLQVTALAGQLDNLWVGTMNRGAAVLKAGQLTRFESVLPDAHVLSLAMYGDRVYAGTGMGVAEFRSSQYSRTIAEGEFANSLMAGDGRLWIGTLEEGIEEIPMESKTPRPGRVRRNAMAGRVEKLLQAGKRSYAVMDSGLAVMDEKQGTWRIAAERGASVLADGNISAIALDTDRRLWVGYFDRGLDIVDQDSGRALHREDEHLFCVNKIALRKDGASVATANGLVIMDRGGQTRQVMTRKEGLIASHVTDVIIQRDGMVAATPAGITFLSPGGAQSLYAFHGLVNNHVYALASNGSTILAGTLGGVSVLESAVVKASYTTANSPLRQNWISALAAVGNEWFAGTYGAGVYRFDGAVWQSFADLRTGFVVNPGALCVTESAVYAGSLGNGLAVYNRANGRWGFQRAGLPSSNVTAVAAGGGQVYIGTDNGLVRIDERSLPLP